MWAKALLILVIAGTSLGVHADEIVRWVDSDGVTHFGNPQFAPAGTAQPVEVQPANGMDAPAVRSSRNQTSDRARFTFVDRKYVKNPRGFRGYEGRPSRHQGRRVSH